MAAGRRRQATQKDVGYGWVVVFAFFTSSIIIDGLRYSFGLLYIEFLSEFRRGKGDTAWIGSLMICVYNILGPVIAVGINRFGVRIAAMAGAIISTIGLVASSFADQIYSLYFTYGVIQGFGLGVMYLGGWVAVGRYFEKKRGLAIGIAQCGCGVGAFAISPVLTVLIDHYAWRGAMMILAGLCLNGCVLSMLYRPFAEDFEDIIEADQDKLNNKATEAVMENGKLLVTANDSALLKEDKMKFEKKNNSVGINKTEQKSTLIDRLRKLLRGTNTFDESEPRSFAEMRDQQLEIYKRKVNSSMLNITTWSSSRSVNSLSFRPVILGSDASLEHVLAKRRRNVHLDVGTSNVAIDLTLQSLKQEARTDERKKFSCTILERLFPKCLVTDLKFNLLMASALFYSMATFVPINLIADYGRRVGCEETEVGWFVSAIGIGGTIGRVICGFVVDIECVSKIWFLTAMLLMCSLSNFLCPLLTSFPVLMIFSLVYGICIGSIYVVPPVVLIEVFGEELIAETMGVLMYVCGIVALVGTPIGGWLFDATGSYVFSFLFCGGLFLFAAVFNTCVLCSSRGAGSRDQIHHDATKQSERTQREKVLLVTVEDINDLATQRNICGTDKLNGHPSVAQNGCSAAHIHCEASPKRTEQSDSNSIHNYNAG